MNGRTLVHRFHEFLRGEVFNRIQRKLLAAFLLVVLPPLLGTALYGNWVTSHALGEEAIDAALADLRQRASRIEGYLAGVQEDLLYLSRTGPLRALIDARARRDAERIAYWRERVAHEFAAFAQTHPMVYQVRYLTEDGWEFVRINADHGRVQVVPRNQLQQKAHRYYFAESIKLPRGAIYVSPVDLNREFGRVEVPYKPVIRYATPVFFADGQRAGIVILNLYAEEFLRYVRDGDTERELALVDQDGYYLVHPDPAKTWGRPWDRGTGYRLQLDFPERWPAILRRREGVEFGRRNVVIHVPVSVPGRRDGTYWVLLHNEPRAHLFAAVQSFRLTAAGILVVALLSAVAMAMLLARSITAPVLMLTERVKRFGKEGAQPSSAATARDEIGALAAAFDEMATTLQTNLERLSLLNQAGQHIAAQLDRRAVLTATLQAMEALFPAELRVIRLFDASGGDDHVVASGDERWACHAHTLGAQSARQAALEQGRWHVTLLPPDSGPAGVMCCAPLNPRTPPPASLAAGTSPEREASGVIELYGRHPELGDPATGNLLATLAVQTSIALENAALYSALAEHRAQLQTLVERLIAAQEEERRMVAYDIHDGLIQRLVAARLHLRNYVAQRNEAAPDAERSLEKGLTQLTSAIAEARRVIEGLRPATLDDLGLVPTLEQYAQELGAEAGWELRVEAPARPLRLPPMVEITAFRIAQEALTNVAKHANASQVRVRIEAQADWLVVEIEDTGQGFDPQRPGENGRGLGLIGMQERARVLGGECVIESRPGRGTRVRAVLPLDNGRDGSWKGNAPSPF